MAALTRHAHDRQAPTDGQLLRYTDGRPITRRRYDHLWHRLGTHLPWVATQQISIHWLRHTTLTWVERNFGHAIARAYAGHTGPTETPPTPTSRQHRRNRHRTGHTHRRTPPTRHTGLRHPGVYAADHFINPSGGHLRSTGVTDVRPV